MNSSRRLHDFFKLICLDLAVQHKIQVHFEYRFHPKRRWRFDAAFPGRMVALELDGGVWIAGRHTRGKGFMRDCEKLNTATAMGWKVFRFVPEQLENGEMTAFLDDVMDG